MNDCIKELYRLIQQRKQNAVEGSYTCYLLDQGIDKICKKCGEEATEVIIAAKNGDNKQTNEEICDLIYHLLILMVEQGITLSEIEDILSVRSQKIGNLKQKHISNPQS